LERLAVICMTTQNTTDQHLFIEKMTFRKHQIFELAASKRHFG